MNDDQDRELFGLPPSRQQRTPLKALEALGDENFTAHHERASVAISQGSCEARARRLTTHPSCSSYCFSHLRRGQFKTPDPSITCSLSVFLTGPAAPTICNLLFVLNYMNRVVFIQQIWSSRVVFIPNSLVR